MTVGSDFDAQLPAPEFRQLYRYWQSKHHGPKLPGRKDIDPTEIGPVLLPGIYLVEVLREKPGSLGFRFRLAGTDHLQSAGTEITGMRIEEVFSSPYLERARAAYTQVVERREPLVTLGARSAMVHRSEIIFDRLLLPLATDGQTVDMLLGYLKRRLP